MNKKSFVMNKKSFVVNKKNFVMNKKNFVMNKKNLSWQVWATVSFKSIATITIIFKTLLTKWCC